MYTNALNILKKQGFSNLDISGNVHNLDFHGNYVLHHLTLPPR